MESVHLYGASEFSAASAVLAGKPVVVGRSGDLRLEGDALEKKHARFTLRDGKVFAAPMGRGVVYLERTPLAGESALAPGDLVILARSAAVFVAHTVQQEPSQQAREVLAAYGRDRVLVRLLELPSSGLVRLALEKLERLDRTHLHALAAVLRPALEALSRQADAVLQGKAAALLASLEGETPRSAVFVCAEMAARREAAAAALPPLPPIDEEAEVEASAGAGAPTRAWHMVRAESDVGHGFSWGAPPIDVAEWPRSPRDGVPMTHLATLLVPAEYRVAVPGKIAISLFQADDHLRPSVPGAPRHEGSATVLEDEIGGSYALVWLDAEAFARGPGRDPPSGVSLKAPQFLRLRARIGDPNVGKVIPDWDEDPGDYIPFVSEEGQALALERYQFQTSHALVHFGGTSVAVDNFAGGLGPFYMGLEHGFGGANFGGGNAVLDLARQRIVFGS